MKEGQGKPQMTETLHYRTIINRTETQTTTPFLQVYSHIETVQGRGSMTPNQA